MIQMIRKTSLLMVAMLVAATTTLANEPLSPQAVVDTTINEIIRVLDAREDKTILSDEDINAIREISKQHVNYKYIASRLLGKTTWKKLIKLGKQQKKAYTDDYVSHYREWLEIYMADKLSQYNGQTINFIKGQGKRDPQKKYAAVKLTVDNKGKEIKLDFTLRKIKGSWMIIDFAAEGISIPKSIESDFKAIMNGPDTVANHEKLIARIDELKAKVKEKVQN